MRVLLVNKRYIPHAQAGPAFSVQYLAEGLQRAGHHASVLCRNPEVSGVREVRGVECRGVHEALSPEEALQRAVRALDELKPDVVHVYFQQGFPVLQLLGQAQARGIATVQTICTYSYLCETGSLFKQRRCTTFCDKCIAVSSAMQPINTALDGVVFVSRFVKEIHQTNGFFLEPPVQDVIWCSYDAEPGSVVRNVETTVSRPLRLGFLGRIDPAKGLPLLLPAVSSEALLGKVTLTIAGGAAPEVLMERRTQYPSVRFLGFVDRTELFQQIDVLVVPSLWDDPLPRVIYEAYAHGIPVIGSLRGGIAEAIDDGITGLTFEPTEPGALERTILGLVEDRARVVKMSAAALDKAEAFSTRSVVPRYVNVYERSVEAAPKRQGARR